jgi:hypothetical protein
VRLPLEIEEFIRAYLILNASIGDEKKYDEIPMRVKGGESKPPLNLRLLFKKGWVLSKLEWLTECIYEELEKNS